MPRATKLPSVSVPFWPTRGILRRYKCQPWHESPTFDAIVWQQCHRVLNRPDKEINTQLRPR
jgi:hypothetical protein